MVRIVVTAGVEADLTPGKAKFIGLSRVIRGLSDYNAKVATGLDVRDAVARTAVTQRTRQRKALPRDACRLLRIGWQTELVARLGEQLDDPGLRQATLQTLPVQAYYAVFSVARALSHVSTPIADSHHQIHEHFAAMQREGAFGMWGVSLAGDPNVVSACTLDPAICQPIVFNPMEVRVGPEEYVWAALRMARRWRIERARTAWMADKKNRTTQGKPYKLLPQRGRNEILGAERETTIMDFLYELRCGSNYRSIDEYAVEIEDRHVVDFHSGLVEVMDAGLAHYEAQIARYVGTTALQREFANWSQGVRGIGSWTAAPGAGRIAAFSAAGL
jgi:hypothetical protein